MFRIKRTKATGEGERRIVATHYVTAVSRHGSIDGWSRDPAEAVVVSQGAAKRIREFHSTKKNVGTLTFEPVDASPADLARSIVADDVLSAVEFGKLQDECKRLLAENASLRESVEQASAAAAAAHEREKQALGDHREARDLIQHHADTIATLTARVAELESDLAQATAPAVVVDASVTPVADNQESPKGGGKRK